MITSSRSEEFLFATAIIGNMTQLSHLWSAREKSLLCLIAQMRQKLPLNSQLNSALTIYTGRFKEVTPYAVQHTKTTTTWKHIRSHAAWSKVEILLLSAKTWTRHSDGEVAP